LNTGDCCIPLWKKCPAELALLLDKDSEVCPTLDGIAAVEFDAILYGEEYIRSYSTASLEVLTLILLKIQA
jgi:formate dehydrogenase maturation protein FdhE